MQVVNKLVVAATLAGLAVPAVVAAEPQMLIVPSPDPAWVRAISADGTTVVGESAGEVFRYSAARGYEAILADSGFAGDPTAALNKPGQSALAISADGSVVVGAITGSEGKDQPYRWSDSTGTAVVEFLLTSPGPARAADSGVARGVSANGQVVVGSFSNSLANNGGGDAICRGLGCTERKEYVHAFRWQRLPAAVPEFADLGASLPDSESVAVAIARDGVDERTLLQRQTQPLPCFGPVDPGCLRPGDLQPAMLLDANGNDLLAGQLQVNDIVSNLSADGSTVVGSAVGEAVPFRWRADSYFQLLGRQLSNSRVPVQRLGGSMARDASANGELVVGDFGIWLEGRSTRLKNLLVNGLGLKVLGWDFEQYFRGQAFAGFVPPAKAAIAPGLHATSDDGSVWAGVGLSPQGIAQAILVQTNGLVDSDLMDSLPPWEPQALANAALPHARMARVGQTVGVFATMMNTSANDLAGCGVALRGDLPLTMQFVATDPATNAMAGELDNYFLLPAGAAQTLALLFTPTAPFAGRPLDLVFDCGNTEPGFASAGAQRVSLGASEDPVIDVLAVAGTLANDGTVRLDDNLHGAFVVATQNLGEASGVASIDIQAGSSLIESVLCETDALTGVCLNPAQARYEDLVYAPGQSRTFAVFVAAERALRKFVTSQQRITVNFRNSAGELLGSTSVAVE